MATFYRTFATWDGVTWTTEPGPENDLLVFDLDSDGTPELYGAHFAIGEYERHHVVRRDGETWVDIAGILGPAPNYMCHVWALAGLDDDGDGPHPPTIFAAGYFGVIAGVPANGMAKWDGISWTAADAGYPGDAQDMIVYDDDGDGPNVPVLYMITKWAMYAWNGAAWTQMWSMTPSGWHGLKSLAVFDDDGDGPNLPALYVAGRMHTDWGAPGTGVARWDGTSWSNLGEGFCMSDFNFPYTMAGFDEDGPGPNPPSLYVGGTFGSVEGQMARQITRWGRTDGGHSVNCDGDEVLDQCQIAADPTLDCNTNGVLDSCELTQPLDPFGRASSWATYHPGDNGVGGAGYSGAVFDGRYVYFVPYYDGEYHGEVLRYDTTEDFTDLGSWAAYEPGANGVGSDPDGYVGGVFDGRYVYFAPAENDTAPHGEVLRYDTELPFGQSSSWSAFDATVAPGVLAKGGYRGAIFDGQYVYFVPYYDGTNYHSEVLRYDTGLDFQNSASWATFAPLPDGGYWGGTFDGRYVYFAPYYNGTAGCHGEVLRYDTTAPASFTDPAAWESFDVVLNGVGATPAGYRGAAYDGQYVYFAPYYNGTEHHGEILRFDTGLTFASADSWKVFDARSMNVGHRAVGFTNAIFDGRYVYFVPYRDNSLVDREIHGEVLRYDTTGEDLLFNDSSLWTPVEENEFCLGTERGGYLGGVFDGRYVYFSPYEHQYRRLSGVWDIAPSGEVVRYDATAGQTADCNTNGIPDECDLNPADPDGDGEVSADCDQNDTPDVCEPDLIIDCDYDVDNGETVTVNPGGGSGDQTEDALVSITNESGTDDATIVVEETDEDLHPGACGDNPLDTTLVVDTSLDDGQFRMTVSIPLDLDEMNAELPANLTDPCDLDPEMLTLMWFNPSSGCWENTVSANIADAENPDAATCDPDPKIGCQSWCGDPVTSYLGDYGLFWNGSSGFVWANIDHASDFATAVGTCTPGDCDCDGDVDLSNYADWAGCLSGPAGGLGALCGCFDLDADADVDLADFGQFQDAFTGSLP
jgi:hypothetical protein